MKPLSLEQMEKDAVKSAFRFERSNAADCHADDDKGHIKMLLTDEEIGQVLDGVMPERTQEAQIWRIVRWMQEHGKDSDDTEFDYESVFYEWCCYPHDTVEMLTLLRDYGDAEGLSIAHIIWFRIRKWLESMVLSAIHGETLESETDKRNEIYLKRWQQYKKDDR